MQHRCGIIQIIYLTNSLETNLEICSPPLPGFVIYNKQFKLMRVELIKSNLFSCKVEH